MTSGSPPRPRPARASGSVIAVAVFAILAGALGALVNLALIFSGLSRFPMSANYPESIRPFVSAVWIFFLLCALFVVVVGVQLMRLRNWARVSLLVVAGCLLFFGVIGLGVILATLFVVPSPDPLISKGLLATVLGITYGIPVGVSLWWLILLTRSSVVAQFQAAAALDAAARPPAASLFNNPQCPLAIRIVGWYLASFVFVLPFLPFFPGRFPAFFFGHVFHGPAAFALLLFNFALLVVSGLGLLLLKGWSYPLTVASQLFVCANGLAATFSPAFRETIRAVVARMELPQLPADAEQIVRYSRYFNLLGLLVPVAILITLLVVRRQFFAAAGAAGLRRQP